MLRREKAKLTSKSIGFLINFCSKELSLIIFFRYRRSNDRKKEEGGADEKNRADEAHHEIEFDVS